MSDITPLFKATVKTVKSRKKAQLGSNGVDKSILQTTKKKSEFTLKTKTLIDSISKLKDYLLVHRKEYISCGSPNVQMTDAERDQIDQHAENIMKVCRDAVKQLRNEASNNKVLPQVKEFREEVFSQIEKYLKGVCEIYSEQKAVRVKKVVNKKQISRLETEAKEVKNKLRESSGTKQRRKNLDEPGNSQQADGDAENQEESDSQTEIKKSVKEDTGMDFDVTEARIPDVEEELSPEEAQMFADENQQLFEEMNSLIDEVRHIEGKVVEISKLQGIFTEKVLEQDATIDRIADTVVGTSENIIDANEDIREAMKNNAGLRVWILFILIVFTFSLLFLDWYNP